MPSILNRSKKEVKGVYGFVASILKLSKEFSTDKFIVCFDTETSMNNNKELNSDYKSNRPDYSTLPENENPFIQLDYIIKALNQLNIPTIQCVDNEADDYLASIAKKYEDSYNVIIVSSDKDLLQIVSDNIQVYNAQAKILYTKEKIKEKFNVNVEDYILYKALVGDNSDNIKGIKGVGPKTAVKLINDRTSSVWSDYSSLIETNLKIMTLNCSLCTNINIHPYTKYYKTWDVLNLIID
jgi:DNA polymerase-1